MSAFLRAPFGSSIKAYLMNDNTTTQLRFAEAPADSFDRLMAEMPNSGMHFVLLSGTNNSKHALAGSVITSDALLQSWEAELSAIEYVAEE